MDLKKRLKFALVIMILVPLLMMVLSARLITLYMGNAVEQTYGIHTDTMQMLTNPTRILNRMTREVYNQIRLNAIQEPEKFEDTAYMKKLNDELSDQFSFLVLRKNGEIVYWGNSEGREDLKALLPEFGNYNTDLDGGIYTGDRNSVLIKHQDFYFSDGSEGSVFIITHVEVLVPQVRNSLIQVIVCMVIIISLTAMLLVFWLYRTIIRPLDKLKKATKEMRDGNLNYAISGDPVDEIGQLCLDFDEMREHMKELIEERLQYEQDSRELISNISHDLKTPLTAIKGYSEGLIDKIADTEEKRDKYIRTIYTKANDMSVLVDELSFYSKIDGNTVPYNFIVLDSQEYFTDCMEDMSLDLEVKNIRLSVQNGLPEGTKIFADPEQLRRVIVNIVSNSVKYQDKEKGEIVVRLKDAKDQVLVELEDNGAGIDAKDLPYIFDRFYRADASRNSRKGGTGLGLAIVKKIVEEHGGTIGARSELGVGTTIYFTLPKHLEKAEETVTKPAKKAKKRRILVTQIKE